MAGILDDDHIYTGWDIENTDKLFLLSASEINNTAYGFDRTGLHERSDKRVALTTAFARHVPMYRHGRGCSVVVAWWWLRSPCGHSGFDMAYSVDESELREDNFVDGNGEVRVALNLNQESVLFLSAAVGGKSSVAVGDGFALADYTGDKSWKVTLKDISIAAPNATVTQEPTIGGVDYLAAAADADETIYLTCPIEVTYDTAPTVTYTAQAITEAKANFVSAIAVNSADKYVNYAKISNSESETDKEVDFDSLADGAYKMFIFAEKENGDKQTDYASAFSNEEGYEFYKGTVIINEDELSKEYKDKDLTVRLGGGFNLIFENDIYDTEIIVAANYSGTITGETSNIKSAGSMTAINDITGAKITAETDGTTLTEKVTVEEKAQLACCGRIKFMDLGLDGELNIENDAIVELRGIAIGDKGVIRMKENATLINNSGEKVTVLVDISGEKQKTVTVNNGETYNSSHSGGSSSSGCNAGFGIAMLLFAAAMLRKRKR
ncbi:MAG: DUF6273 domain-containing protein [Synergistes sp.]|nr:DUF6273 domain-containing protein [Synergistes sp.]